VQWYMLIIGAVLSLAGIALLLRRILFLTNAATADGTIVGVVERHRRYRGHTMTYYHPRVRFTAMDKKEYKVVGTMGSSNPLAFEPGTGISVWYDPDNPEKAMLRGLVHLLAAPIALFVLGVIPVYIGLKAVIGF